MAGPLIRRRRVLAALCLVPLPGLAPRALADARLVLNVPTGIPLSKVTGKPGFVEALLGEMFRRIGREFELQALPSVRGLENANAGIDDGDAGRPAGREADYPNLIRVEGVLMDTEFVALVTDPKITITSWSDLAPYAVAYVAGWTVFEGQVKGVRDLVKVRDPEHVMALLGTAHRRLPDRALAGAHAGKTQRDCSARRGGAARPRPIDHVPAQAPQRPCNGAGTRACGNQGGWHLRALVRSDSSTARDLAGMEDTSVSATKDRLPGDGIARRLIIGIILFSSLITAVITATQLFQDYRDGVEAITARFTFIEKSFLPALVDSVWVMDETQIITQLRALRQFPELEYLAISGESGQHWSAGERVSRRQISHSVVLEREHRGRLVRIGKLEIVGGVDAVLARILDRLFIVLAENAFKTVLVAGFALVLFNRLVTRHLTALSAHARSISAASPEIADVRLDRPESGWGRPDMLDDLARAMNGMRRRLVRAAEELRASAEELRAVNETLERRVRERTAELEASNRDLESFNYSVSHDLRGPLRAMHGFASILKEDAAGVLDEAQNRYVARITAAADQMSELIDGLLQLGQVARQDMKRETVDLSTLAAGVVEELREANPERSVEVRIQPGVSAHADPALMRVVLTNLLGNAWKFTQATSPSRIDFGVEMKNGRRACFVRDNGAGFDMQFAGELFKPFHRLHSVTAFEGSGIGLATVARIIERHGGRIRADAAVGGGATFFFTLE
ncbi:MAG: hypothetical protein HY017_09625 [Betaproteobacteria bacterium]|nr:hypothetical protein [Betaproteobacteria bacterium]